MLLSPYHWSNSQSASSPFVLVFDEIGFKYAAWTLNVVILTVTLSLFMTVVFTAVVVCCGACLTK
ncbi:MAG: hypothetical protein LE168_00575 [Endomicrobium sp.]|nr:hypothetical protein [Endomicrobium sp.]